MIINSSQHIFYYKTSASLYASCMLRNTYTLYTILSIYRNSRSFHGNGYHLHNLYYLLLPDPCVFKRVSSSTIFFSASFSFFWRSFIVCSSLSI